MRTLDREPAEVATDHAPPLIVGPRPRGAAGSINPEDNSTTTIQVMGVQMAAPHNPVDLALLSANEKRTASSFRFDIDRASYVIAHALLRRLLAGRLDLHPQSIVFARSPCPTCGSLTGRPRSQPYEGLEFSLSRTRGAVAVAIALDLVGVDIEHVRPKFAPTAIDKLHPLEQAAIRSRAPLSAAAYARCWVRKESVLKARGTGLGHGYSDPLVGAGARPAPMPGWSILDLPVGPRFNAAVATKGTTVPALTVRGLDNAGLNR